MFVLQMMQSSESFTTSCSVCLEQFEPEGARSPKLLPCSHTLCFGCLQGFSSLFPCPECRRMTMVPLVGAGGFPTNRYVLDVIQLLGSAILNANQLAQVHTSSANQQSSNINQQPRRINQQPRNANRPEDCCSDCTGRESGE